MVFRPQPGVKRFPALPLIRNSLSCLIFLSQAPLPAWTFGTIVQVRTIAVRMVNRPVRLTAESRRGVYLI